MHHDLILQSSAQLFKPGLVKIFKSVLKSSDEDSSSK